MVITLNSDDPAYFGGYVLENYQWVQQLLGLSVNQVHGQLRAGDEAGPGKLWPCA